MISIICILLILVIQIRFSNPQQMMVNPELENTDPIGGFQTQKQSGAAGIDADSIIVQKINLGSTTYHLIDDPSSHPIFTRTVQDRGKSFVIFTHPSFPAGSGHYIVLKRIKGQTLPGISRVQEPPQPTGGLRPNGAPGQAIPQLFYEVYALNFRDSIHGTVSDLDPFLYSFMQHKLGIRRVKTRKRKLGGRNGRRYMP